MLRKTQAFLLVLGLMASACTAAGKSPAFVWLPERITAKVAYDHEYLHLGQYLLLKQDLPPGTQGWMELKIDFPDSREIQETALLGEGVHFVTKDSGSYLVTVRNVGALSSRTPAPGASVEAEIEEVWRRHALDER